MEKENLQGTLTEKKRKNRRLWWIVIALLAVAAAGYIIFVVVFNGKDKPSDKKDEPDDPTMVTVWRMKEEKLELHPTGTAPITDCNSRILTASGRKVCTFDEAGNPVSEITYDESGKETTRIEMEYSLDSEGRWTQVVQKSFKNGQQNYLMRDEFVYDERGNRISSMSYTTPIGKEEYLFSGTEYTYNDKDQLVSDGIYSYEYNEQGQLIRMLQGDLLSQEFIYDDKGNLRKEIVYSTRQMSEKLGVGDVVFSAEYRDGQKVEPAVDEYGRTIREFDENGNIVKFTDYSPQTLPGDMESYIRFVSEYHYENGYLTEIVTTYYNRKGNATGTSRVTYMRDDAGNNLKEETYNKQEVLTHCIERDKYGNVIFEAKYTDDGDLIFSLERSYVSFKVSKWALTRAEVLEMKDYRYKY